MRTTKDLAWLGGLLEGEASFMMRKGSPKIALQMTDLDVMQKVARILDVKVGDYSRKPKGKETYLPVWHLAVHGIKAIGWMLTLYQFFGDRRQAKIREVVSSWRDHPASPRSSRGMKLMSVCHPDRPRSAGTLFCPRCRRAEVMKMWRHRTGKNTNYYRKDKDGRRISVGSLA